MHLAVGTQMGYVIPVVVVPEIATRDQILKEEISDCTILDIYHTSKALVTLALFEN